jgi:hypothetical protein
MALKNRARIYDEMRQPDRAEQDLDAAVAYGRTYSLLGSPGASSWPTNRAGTPRLSRISARQSR